MINWLKRLLRPAPIQPQPSADDPQTPFRCNICGHNTQAPYSFVSNREAQSCQYCRSSLRMRSVIRALSLGLFGESKALPEFPEDKNILGLGMSDWDGYALPLAGKLGYRNTYYHTAPKLDITDIQGWQENNYDFVISSDVFEHIPPPVSIAFENVCLLLKPGGIFLFTVPFTKTGVTQEHFPDLHNFRIETRKGSKILINRTKDGKEQVFEDLVFHGGEGFTLELRMFSEPSLVEALQQAGFEQIIIHSEHQPEFGVIWPMDWAVPVTARKPT